MTTHTPAPAYLTDAEIQALWDEACKDGPQSPGWNRHIRFAHVLLSALRGSVPGSAQLEFANLLDDAPRAEELATRLVASGPKAAHVSASETHEIADFVHASIALLSKLRAPVADAKLRAALMEMVECARLHRDAWDAIWSGMSDREQEGRRLQRQHFKRLPKALEAAEAALDAKPWPVEQQPDGTVTSVDRAALASAPVAGEACQTNPVSSRACERGTKSCTVEHAAPQASEAVPVAWAIFSPSGNIRYWHRDKSNVEAFAAKHGLTVCGLANAGPQSRDAEQIADLVLGHAEGLRVSSLLESGTGFGKDVEHRFQVSNGEDRYGVVIILTALSAQPGAQKGGSDA